MGVGQRLLAACLCIGGGSACGGHTAPSAVADATATETRTTAATVAGAVTATTDTSSTSLPACSWPASLDRTDAYPIAGCFAERTQTICREADGGRNVCGLASCTASDYVVICGYATNIPSGCQPLPAGPEGAAACCPCGP
jgi:hypothetical protein